MLLPPEDMAVPEDEEELPLPLPLSEDAAPLLGLRAGVSEPEKEACCISSVKELYMEC